MEDKKIKFGKVLPHLFIATPMYGGMCTGEYAISLINLTKELQQRNLRYSYLCRFNESLIDRARNALAANFLVSEATHLLFIDADIKFNAEEVLAMVDADKDIICGIYPSKAINWSSVEAAVKAGVPTNELENCTGTWVVNFVDYKKAETVKFNEPFEVFNGGTGMMLIKREVFEKMQNKVEKYRVNEGDAIMQKFDKSSISRFFATSVDDETGVLLSEDYHFCKTWREMGGKIYAAPWVNLSHVGTYTFNGRPTRDN